MRCHSSPPLHHSMMMWMSVSSSYAPLNCATFRLPRSRRITCATCGDATSGDYENGLNRHCRCPCRLVCPLVLRHIQAAPQPPQHLRSVRRPPATGLTVTLYVNSDVSFVSVRPPCTAPCSGCHTAAAAPAQHEAAVSCWIDRQPECRCRNLFHLRTPPWIAPRAGCPTAAAAPAE